MQNLNQNLAETVAEVVAALRGHHEVSPVIERLKTEFPGRPETLFCQGLHAWSQEYAGHAWRYWWELTQAFPESSYSAFPRLILEEIQQRVVARGGLTGLVAFEEVLVAVQQGTAGPNWRAAVEEAARKADGEGLHQLGRACFRIGGLDVALELAGRALGQKPNSVEALSEAGFYLMMSGEVEQAEEICRRLAGHPQGFEAALTLLAGLGRDSEVLLLFGQSHRQAVGGDPDAQARIHHLAAVSSARQGYWSDAVDLWTRALNYDPNLHIAEDNWRNADLPPEERHSPWPFPFWHWVPSEEPGAREKLCKIALPILLDRGDPYGTVWAMRLALADPQGCLESLLGFATGSRGREEWRALAVRVLDGMNLLPQEFSYYCRGEWSKRTTSAPVTEETPARSLFSPTSEALISSLASSPLGDKVSTKSASRFPRPLRA